MSERTATRRTVLKTGAAAVGAALLPTASASSGWTSVTAPVDGTLYDVEETDEGAYAVGASGVVLERTSSGWQKVVDGGPTGNGNTLYGSDVTDDGERLWFVGSSGSIGEYDVSTGDLNDYSAPNGVTNNFNDVAVTRQADEANVYVAGDSGKVYFSFDNGETWDSTTPGSGSNINAIDFYDDRKGHLVDGNKSVFHTQDGETWDKIGIADANANFYGVDSDGADDVWVCGGNGMVYHWDGSKWTPEDTGDADLRDIEVESGDGYTVGSGGAVYDRVNGKWKQDSTPTGANLKAVVRASDPDIAVGAAGTIIEH